MRFTAVLFPGSFPYVRRLLSFTGLLLFAATVPGRSGNPAAAPADSAAATGQGYRIDQPGTITFTVGVKISGKVEKPQVVIFLPKEKTLYREEVFSRSFSDELSQPLPFNPIIR
jgi:hypothetical protein